MIRLLLAIVLAAMVLAFGGVAQAQLTLEIPEEEFESVEEYKSIPIPDPSGGPANQMLEAMDLDLTDTLPEAVLESILGESPYEFVDVVWGMEVTGDWVDSFTGTGTLQVTNFTEGRGASPHIDREKYTGANGFRMYNSRLETDGDHLFTLSAIFPPDSDGQALGTEVDEVKGLFEATWLCHMFEPERTGCIDYPDEYYETELPILRKLHVHRHSDGYKIGFAARVEESRTHRDHGYRSTALTGRVGDVRGWVCDRASWENDPEACEIPESLKVVGNSPSHRRENVHLGSPRIEMEFNEPVDPISLKENFLLVTRGSNGDLLEVDGQINQATDRVYRFIPDADLESGVIYEARLEGGEDGVRSESGTTLTSSEHWWRFSTLVDLENHGGPVEDPMRVHAYQSVRDAPLVMGKPTVQRIYVDWEPHEHIDPAWQPETYPAELAINVLNQDQWRVDPQQGGAIDANVVRVVRTDLLEKELIRRDIERHALHTINVYGWTPETQGGSSVVEVRLTPHDPHPASVEAQDVIAERQVQHWHVDPDPLVFLYSFLEVGSWKDGVPEIDRQWANGIVTLAEEFAIQVMPIKEAYGVDTTRTPDRAYVNTGRGIVPGGIDAVVTTAEALGWIGISSLEEWAQEKGRPTVSLASLKNTIRKLRMELQAVVQPNDILVVFAPPDFYGAGQSIHGTFSHEEHRGIVLPITTTRSRSALAQALVHEFGHYFGLVHRPADKSEVFYPPSAYSDYSIEGFRVARDGMSGWNKSAVEGNGEHPTTLAPLMWPYAIPRREVFVSEGNYEAFMRVIETR